MGASDDDKERMKQHISGVLDTWTIGDADAVVDATKTIFNAGIKNINILTQAALGVSITGQAFTTDEIVALEAETNPKLEIYTKMQSAYTAGTPERDFIDNLVARETLHKEMLDARSAMFNEKRQASETDADYEARVSGLRNTYNAKKEAYEDHISGEGGAGVVTRATLVELDALTALDDTAKKNLINFITGKALILEDLQSAQDNLAELDPALAELDIEKLSSYIANSASLRKHFIDQETPHSEAVATAAEFLNWKMEEVKEEGRSINELDLIAVADDAGTSLANVYALYNITYNEEDIDFVEAQLQGRADAVLDLSPYVSAGTITIPASIEEFASLAKALKALKAVQDPTASDFFSIAEEYGIKLSNVNMVNTLLLLYVGKDVDKTSSQRLHVANEFIKEHLNVESDLIELIGVLAEDNEDVFDRRTDAFAEHVVELAIANTGGVTDVAEIEEEARKVVDVLNTEHAANPHIIALAFAADDFINENSVDSDKKIHGKVTKANLATLKANHEDALKARIKRYLGMAMPGQEISDASIEKLIEDIGTNDSKAAHITDMLSEYGANLPYINIQANMKLAGPVGQRFAVAALPMELEGKDFRVIAKVGADGQYETEPEFITDIARIEPQLEARLQELGMKPKDLAAAFPQGIRFVKGGPEVLGYNISNESLDINVDVLYASA
jgi:hypothetical protein